MKPQGTLGTFSGVFTPSILTILGIILFLRLGYVVGSAGLCRALTMIAVANAISILTSISLAAIATNIHVKGGGDYYLISRTLGPEFGGAIGVVLFMAQSVSIAFYCAGFGEALAEMLPSFHLLSPRGIALGAVVLLFVFAWLGSDWAARFQFLVMALLGTALVSFFWGAAERFQASLLIANWGTPTDPGGFWRLFAVFFPAVTGFTQGVSMSGDLKDPGKSLPAGTFAAVGVSIGIYLATAVLFAASLPAATLSADYTAMKTVARFGFLIDAGVVSATLSSGMASFMGAPRILQSLSADRIFPLLQPFAAGSGPSGNPRRAVLLSLAIAMTTVALGNLNVIAPVVSMFFLISYGLLNYATYFEARTQSPSFRPRFKGFDRRLSLAGFLACAGVMLAIDFKTALVAMAVLFGIHQYLQRTVGPSRWADTQRSYHLQRLREHLLEAAAAPEHPRDWRPQILAFSNSAHRRRQLIQLAAWLEGGAGTTTVVRILEDRGDGLKSIRRQQHAENELRRALAAEEGKVFARVVSAPNLELGTRTLIQCFGIGPLQANIALLNWIEPLSGKLLGLKEMRYGRNLRTAFRLGCSIVILHADDDAWERLTHPDQQRERIDVWWRDDASSRLMLLLAYLMTRRPEWSEAKIHAVAADPAQASGKDLLADIQTTLEAVRIEAVAEIAGRGAHALVRHSTAADIVFVPFRLRGHRIAVPFDNHPEELLAGLPVAVLVSAAEDMDLDAEPEEGPAAELAAAMDALADARKKMAAAEKDASKRAIDAEARKRDLLQAESAAARGEAGQALQEAEAEALKAFRRAAKAMAKVESAAAEVAALGGDPQTEDLKAENHV